MPIQAWIDDSGGKGQSVGLVLAGWIGEAEDWAAFSDDWRECLGQSPRIKYFKMHEASSRSGQFLRIPEEFRNKKLRDLARIIRKYDFTAYWCVSDMKAFDETLARIYRKPFSDYYFWGYIQTILGIGYDISNRGVTEEIEVIFDEQNIFGPNTKTWYPLIKKGIKDERIRQALPAEPLFRDDKKFLPLQAADMLAWTLNRSLTGNNPFLWLWEEELRDIKTSTGTQALDRDRLNSIVESARLSLVNRNAARRVFR